MGSGYWLLSCWHSCISGIYTNLATSCLTNRSISRLASFTTPAFCKTARVSLTTFSSTSDIVSCHRTVLIHSSTSVLCWPKFSTTKSISSFSRASGELKRVTKGWREDRNWVIWEEEVDGVAARDQDGQGASNQLMALYRLQEGTYCIPTQ